MSAKHRVAVVQAASTPFLAEPAVDKAARLIAEAGAGARSWRVSRSLHRRLSQGIDFATPVGARLPGARDSFLRYFEGAIEVPGPRNGAPRRGGARTQACSSVDGVIERDGGTLYCTALFFGPEGGSWASTAS